MLLSKREFLISSNDGGKTWAALEAIRPEAWLALVPKPGALPLPASVAGDELGDERCSPTRGTIVVASAYTAPAPTFMTDGTWDGESFGILDEILKDDATGEVTRFSVILRAGFWPTSERKFAG